MAASIKLLSIVAMGLGFFSATSTSNASNTQTLQTTKQTSSGGLLAIKKANWWEEGQKEPVIHLVIDKGLQTVSVYSNERLISKSNVSTGKEGYETPGGIFSILSKNRTHFSNIYANSPMPFMQRLTWSGIALHKSKSVPDYPASHGCIRLPSAFASQLFKFTRNGAQVIVTRLDVRPEKFSSPDLFSIGIGSIPGSKNLRPTFPVVASAGKSLPVVSTKPLRVLLTRNSGREKLTETQKILNELGYDAGDADGWMGPQTGRAIKAFQTDYKHNKSGALSDGLLRQLYSATGRGEPKNGHVYVRRNKKPLFDMAVVLTDEKVPLGTHHFTAVYPDESAGENAGGNDDDIKASRPYWLSMTIEQTGWAGRDEGDFTSPSTARRALARFKLPDDLKQKISAMIIQGSTVSIADQGISKETVATGTDFIVLTK